MRSIIGVVSVIAVLFSGCTVKLSELENKSSPQGSNNNNNNNDRNDAGTTKTDAGSGGSDGGPACTPDCTGRVCGSDGCGGYCSPGCNWQLSEGCGAGGQCTKVGLHTESNHIYTADDNVFRGRGANLPDFRGCGACMMSPPSLPELKRRVDELVDVWKADFIRLLLENRDSRTMNYNGQTITFDPNNWANPISYPQGAEQYLANVRDIVRYIGTKPNVYVLVSVWNDPTIDSSGWPTSDTYKLWQMLVGALYDQPHVLFGVINEPQYNGDGKSDAEVWNRMNSAVEAIRSAEKEHSAPPHIIAVQGTRMWARYLEYYITHPLGEQIAYETHVYNPQSEFAELVETPAKTLPVIIGEFGPAKNGATMSNDDITKLMDLADNLEIPYTAWSFHMRCDPSLLVDYSNGGCGVGMKLEPTSDWGVLIKNRLQQPR